MTGRLEERRSLEEEEVVLLRLSPSLGCRDLERVWLVGSLSSFLYPLLSPK